MRIRTWLAAGIGMIMTGTFAQYNYYNFLAAPAGNPTFTSAGNGMGYSPSNEVFYKSSNGFMGRATLVGSNWVQSIVSVQAPKALSEFVFGDGKVFYVDEYNKLRETYPSGSVWISNILNTNAPDAAGTGLAWAGGSTLYYTTTTGAICRIANAGAPNWNWNYEITTAATAKANSPVVCDGDRAFYIDNTGTLRELFKMWGMWLNGDLNASKPAARGDGLALGTSSNILYTTAAGTICNVYYTTAWNYELLNTIALPQTGSRFVMGQGALYYVGTDNYLYVLSKDNCDWFNKKVVKTAASKPEAFCFGNGQLFFRNYADNVVYNVKTQSSSAYIYLKDKVFYKNNAPHYPVVMNYGINLCTSTDLSTNPDQVLGNLWASPRKEDYFFGVCTPCYSASASDADLAADFTRMKQLGITAVRLYGLCGLTCGSTGSSTCSIKVLYRPAANPEGGNWYPKNYDPSADPTFKNQLFGVVNHVCSLATAAGLDVVLLTGNGYIHRMDNYSPNAPYIKYGAYLEDLANYFKNTPGILAYDLDNEPGANPLIPQNPKTDNCFISSYWYDKIRNYDKNHLVTLGVFGREDLPYWDPTVLSVDFVSFHLYGFGNENNVANYKEDVKAQLKWIQNNVRLPWIVGETTYSGIDVATPDWENGVVGAYDCNSPSGPYPQGGSTGWGSLADQLDYVRFSMQATRNAGGSGYSWWTYKDNARGANQTNIEAFEGIVTLCHNEKPSAAEFNQNWLSYSCTGLADATAQFTYHYNVGQSYPVEVTGKLQDVYGNPLKGGRIAGKWGVNSGDWVATFTQNDGTFRLVCNGAIPYEINYTAPGKILKIDPGPVPNYYGTPISYSAGNITLADIACSPSSNLRKAAAEDDQSSISAEQVEVFPNPSNGTFTVLIPSSAQAYRMRVLDVQGREVQNADIKTEEPGIRSEINLKNAEHGIYFLQLIREGKVIVKKLLVM